MTYEEIEQLLRDNHFVPDKEITLGTKGEKITALHVNAPSSRTEDVEKRLNEILKDCDVKISPHSSKGYLEVKKKKVS